MIQFTRTTEPLHAIDNNCVVTPSDFKDVPFTSALLLPHSFDASLVAHPDFLSSCDAGFDTYFESMRERTKFLNHFHTWQEVKSEIILSVFPDPVDMRLSAIHGWEPSSLAWRAGFLLGWLSALGLTDRSLALRGLVLLIHLIRIQCSSLLVTEELPILSGLTIGVLDASPSGAVSNNCGKHAPIVSPFDVNTLAQKYVD